MKTQKLSNGNVGPGHPTNGTSRSWIAKMFGMKQKAALVMLPTALTLGTLVGCAEKAPSPYEVTGRFERRMTTPHPHNKEASFKMWIQGNPVAVRVVDDNIRKGMSPYELLQCLSFDDRVGIKKVREWNDARTHAVVHPDDVVDYGKGY